jgi:hypothetical protein
VRIYLMNDTAKNNSIDQNELRVMQSAVMLLLIVGFVFDSWEIIAAQVAIFLLTVIAPVLNPFIAIYRVILRPAGIITADWRQDNIEPHRFASSIGFIVSSLSVYFLYTGATDIGWALSFLIIILGVFAVSGWCAGCFTYYIFNRLGIKGFFKQEPIANSFPGTRPPKNN